MLPIELTIMALSIFGAGLQNYLTQTQHYRFQDYNKPATIYDIPGFLAIILALLEVFISLVCWNSFTPLKIAIFIAIWFFAGCKEKGKVTKPFWICLILFAVLIPGSIFSHIKNLTKIPEPEIETKTFSLVHVSTDGILSSNEEGYYLILKNSLSENATYFCYYSSEEDGLQQGNFPVKDTKVIFFTEKGGTPKIEATTTTTYVREKSDSLKASYSENKKTEYVIYIPKNSIKQ